MNEVSKPFFASKPFETTGRPSANLINRANVNC